MSERERWIVYPLLFFALGAALRDKVLKRTIADQVVCKRIVVRDEADNLFAVIDGNGVKAGRIDARAYLRSGRLLRFFPGLPVPQARRAGRPAPAQPAAPAATSRSEERSPQPGDPEPAAQPVAETSGPPTGQQPGPVGAAATPLAPASASDAAPARPQP